MARTAYTRTASVAGESAVRRATALVTVVMCLVAVSEAGYGAANGGLGEVPMVAALVVLPLLYVVPATRPLWLRHRYLLLAVQAALTYLPFAWFGANWAPSGWLAGLVLLTVPWPAAWFVAAILAALEVAMWTGVVVELSHQPTTPAAVWAMIAFVFDALVLFGLARLVDLITAVHAARDELAEAAVTAERVRAADSLRAAIGGRLAEAADRSAAALQAITGNPPLAREHIAATVVTAREALGEVREVATRYRDRRAQGRPPSSAMKRRRSESRSAASRPLRRRQRLHDRAGKRPGMLRPGRPCPAVVVCGRRPRGSEETQAGQRNGTAGSGPPGKRGTACDQSLLPRFGGSPETQSVQVSDG